MAASRGLSALDGHGLSLEQGQAGNPKMDNDISAALHGANLTHAHGCRMAYTSGLKQETRHMHYYTGLVPRRGGGGRASMLCSGWSAMEMR